MIHRFKEFASEECGLDGDKIPMAEILNKEITVTAYRIMQSKAVKGKECLQLQVELDGENRVVFTNSVVLIRQTQQFAKEIPFLAIIIKRGSYYTFS